MAVKFSTVVSWVMKLEYSSVGEPHTAITWKTTIHIRCVQMKPVVNVHVSKHFPDEFHVHNDMKQDMMYHYCFLPCL